MTNYKTIDHHERHYCYKCGHTLKRQGYFANGIWRGATGWECVKCGHTTTRVSKVI